MTNRVKMRKVESGKWKVGKGKWEKESGKRKVGKGKWEKESGKRKVERVLRPDLAVVLN